MTRSKLIEQIGSMTLGTQAMLDASEDAKDATLLPFNTLFSTKSGDIVWRVHEVIPDASAVRFVGVSNSTFLMASDLLPLAE